MEFFNEIPHIHFLQITYIPSTEPGVVIFKTELVQCQVMLNPTNMQSLHIKITPLPISNVDVKPPVQWNPEELQTIEKFFELRVAAPPYRPNALCGFGRALNVPPQVMKDFVQLMQLDMLPEPLPGQKWAMQFIMRVPPPALVHIVSVGNPALYISNQKILFFVNIPYHFTDEFIYFSYLFIYILCFWFQIRFN